MNLYQTWKNLLIRNHKTESLDIWYVESPSGLYQICSNYAKSAKMTPSWGHMFYIVLYWEKHAKIFLSETTMPRALILSMKHHLVILCQVCSYLIAGAKNGRPRGHIFHIGLYREVMQKSSCLKPWYVATPSGPLPSLFKLCPWCRKWPCPSLPHLSF